MEKFKPIILVLVGLVVIFLYLGTMVFAVEAVLYLAMVLFVAICIQMYAWAR